MPRDLARRELLRAAALAAAFPNVTAAASAFAGTGRAGRDKLAGSPGRVGYHRRYVLSSSNELVEVDAGAAPRKGAVATEFEAMRRRQLALNARLSTPPVEKQVRDAPALSAGVYPLTVTSFTCACEGHDDDGAAAQLTERLGNLRVIKQVPFMRRGDVVFAIRSQGLVDPRTGGVECVDALFNGGIYWRGRLTRERLDYELIMFKRGKDVFVGRMRESIDLTRKLGDIDPDLYQSEVAFHLDRESGDASGRPTLPRNLAAYGDPRRLAQVERCYTRSAAFSKAATASGAEWERLAHDARNACVDVPGKRYYQAYDAWLRGIRYDPTTSA